MGQAVATRAATLARIAAGLQTLSGWPGLPALWFLTDAARTPDPLAIAAQLPEGTAIVLRHYRAPDRAALAAALARIAGRRGLTLFVGADAALASSVGAAGVHLPRWADDASLRPLADLLVTASVHDAQELARRRDIADALIVSPVFATASHAGAPALGPARLTEFVRAAGRPVIALGGITALNALDLRGTGVAGIAASGAFVED
jgi:thiamine-phosphate pyrophosphorylase